MLPPFKGFPGRCCVLRILPNKAFLSPSERMRKCLRRRRSSQSARARRFRWRIESNFLAGRCSLSRETWLRSWPSRFHCIEMRRSIEVYPDRTSRPIQIDGCKGHLLQLAKNVSRGYPRPHGSMPSRIWPPVCATFGAKCWRPGRSGYCGLVQCRKASQTALPIRYPQRASGACHCITV